MWCKSTPTLFSGAWFSARRNSTLLGLKFRSIRNAVLLIQPGIAVLRHTASFSALPIYGKSYSQDTTACSLAYKLCGRTVRFNKCGKTFYTLCIYHSATWIHVGSITSPPGTYLELGQERVTKAVAMPVEYYYTGVVCMLQVFYVLAFLIILFSDWFNFFRAQNFKVSEWCWMCCKSLICSIWIYRGCQLLSGA